MKAVRFVLLAFILFVGSYGFADAQGLSINDVSISENSYRPRLNWFLGVGGGVNIGFNGQPYVSRDNSGVGIGSALDVYLGVMSSKSRLGFGGGVQGLTISDRFTDYGRRQFLYTHGSMYFRLTDYCVPYIHLGAAFTRTASPAGGFGIMLPIKLSSSVCIVPHLKFSAIKGTLMSERGAKVGMVTSVSVGLRFDLGKEHRRKKEIRNIVDELPIPETVHDTVVVRDTVRLIERFIERMREPERREESVNVSQLPDNEVIKEREKQFNENLSSSVLFATGSSKLTLSAVNILNEVARFILENPGIRILVEGHTDNVGADEMNYRLSRDRASAVADYLIKCGVNPFMISSVGYGRSRPYVPNTSEANRLQNRRVEIHFNAFK